MKSYVKIAYYLSFIFLNKKQNIIKTLQKNLFNNSRNHREKITKQRNQEKIQNKPMILNASMKCV